MGHLYYIIHKIMQLKTFLMDGINIEIIFFLFSLFFQNYRGGKI